MGLIHSFLFKSNPSKDSERKGKWRKHYSSCHKILLVGEGDFSFALCLGRTFGSASNIVATSIDSKEFTLKNYSRGASNLKELENLGCTIMHDMDAHTMWKHPMLVEDCFDRIVFNFPQAGSGIIEYPYNSELHKEFVKGFLESARLMLNLRGAVHVTLNSDYPWDVVKLADDGGFALLEKVPFKKSEYPGYTNRKGSGFNCNTSFTIQGGCSTFKFSPWTYDRLVDPVTLKLEGVKTTPSVF